MNPIRLKVHITELDPARLRKVTVELEDLSRLQKISSSAIKVSFFLLLATPYVGVNPQLILAGIIFIIPLVASFTFADSLPKFPAIDRVLPKGTLKLVVLTILGVVVASYMQERFADPTAFLRWCFVIVAIPGLLISILEWFTDTPEADWKVTRVGRWAYKVMGILVFLMAIQVVRGFDFASLL